jgi:hypothetical protein
VSVSASAWVGTQGSNKSNNESRDRIDVIPGVRPFGAALRVDEIATCALATLFKSGDGVV